jgi:hypothetical protein
VTSDAKTHLIRLEGPWEVLGFARAGLQPVFQFRGTLDKALPEHSMEIERLEYSRRFNSPTGLLNTDTVVWCGEIAGELLGIWLNGEPLQWARNEDGQRPGPFLLHSRLRISPLANLGEFAD